MALKAFQQSFKNLQSTDRNLKTAESSQASIPTASNLLINNISIKEDSMIKPTNKQDSLNIMDSTDEEKNIKNMQLQSKKINESSIEKDDESYESDLLSSCQESDYGSENSLEMRGTPSVCSEQEISHREMTQKSFDYKKYLQIEKENLEPNSSQKENTCSTNEILLMKNQLQMQKVPSSKQVTESFRHYLDNMNSNSSTAIAGAMKALQKKIKSLEQENGILKDCFQGIQKKCVDMEKSYQHEILKNQQVMIQQQQVSMQETQSSQRSNSINIELETLQKQLNELQKSQQKGDESKNKYKQKLQQYHKQFKELKQNSKKQEEQFNEQRNEYQQERQILISQMKQLEQQNKDLVIQKQQQELEINKLNEMNKGVEGKYKGKLNKYKKYIHMMRTELKMLEKSHQVSQKALQHTEHFVDEVVYVNDQLVHTLAKNKMKLRSLSGSQGKRRRDINGSSQDNNNFFQDTLNARETNKRRGSVQCHSVSMTPSCQNKQFKSFQQRSNEQQEYELINRTEEPKKFNYTMMDHRGSYQGTVQKPPKSNRNMNRQFSFSKGENRGVKPLQFQNIKNQQQMLPEIIHHDKQASHMLETSRFQEDDSLLNHSPVEGIHAEKSHYETQSKYNSNKSSQKILIDEDFTLQPYERQIDNVSQKIVKIQQELESIGIECQSQRSNDDYLENKQRELLTLKKEHDTLVKNIRERSGSRKRL